MVNKVDHIVDMDDLLYSINYASKHCEMGIKGIAENAGQAEQTLRNKLNPNDDSHRLALSDFVMVMKQADDTEPLDLLCRMFGGQFISRSQGSSDTIIHAVLKAMSEHGDIATALDDAMKDGVIDPAELARLFREIREARNSLVELENTLREKGAV